MFWLYVTAPFAMIWAAMVLCMHYVDDATWAKALKVSSYVFGALAAFVALVALMMYAFVKAEDAAMEAKEPGIYAAWCRSNPPPHPGFEDWRTLYHARLLGNRDGRGR